MFTAPVVYISNLQEKSEAKCGILSFSGNMRTAEGNEKQLSPGFSQDNSYPVTSTKPTLHLIGIHIYGTEIAR